jgi:hypothetical protein
MTTAHNRGVIKITAFGFCISLLGVEEVDVAGPAAPMINLSSLQEG